MAPLPGDDWIDRFPELTALASADRAFLVEHAQTLQLPPGVAVFAPGVPPDGLVMVFDGVVRVFQVGEGGREIVLYRVGPGETCVMTTTCLLADEDYLAEGMTETPVTAVLLPRASFDALMGRSASFRRLMFAAYAARMNDLQRVVEDVAFQRLDKRLAAKLLELAGDADRLDVTHHMLAGELGSAREVVSRMMKTFATRGLVETRRGHIDITDRAALVALAEHT